jgi:DNA polymerase (family X)
VENIEIAAVLRELGDLLEIKGSNPFRIRAYRNAVQTINGLDRSLSEMVEAGEDLTGLPAVGKDIGAHIEELVRTGGLGRLEEVAAEVPRSLVQLVKLDGVGPKKARRLWQELKVTTLDDLEKALEAGQVEELEGFGRASVAKIARAIESYRRSGGRFRLDQVDELIRPLLAYLEDAPGAERVEVAGSYRRRKDTVGDVNVLVEAEGDGTPIADHFTAFDSVARVLSAGDTGASVELRSGLEVDLRVTPRRSFGEAMHYFTGSKEHNVRARQIARKLGLRRIAGETEEEVFGALGLPWIAPVLREDRGEVEAGRTGELPELVSPSDVRGDLHMHSTWSDGKHSVEEMALACRERGYEYLVISDHSPNLAMVQGVTAEKARDQWREIDEVNGRLDGITVLRGMEVDILRAGELDMTDEILEGLDLVLISVHSLMEMDETVMTDRVLRAMEHPAVDILAHPTGRLLGRREAYALDVEAVLQAAAEMDVAVELNANPHRLDLSDVHVRRAKELDVPVVISTDAHSISRLEHMAYGVDQARRGWLEKDDVLNTRSLEELRAWLGRRSPAGAA